MSSQATPSRIISNTAYSVLAYVVYLPVNLYLSRFVVHRIGIDAFGIWAALTSIMAVGGLLDMGVTTPVVKYVAEYAVLGQHKRINTLLGTAMAFYLAVGSTFAVVMALASGWVLAHLFHAGTHDSDLRLLYFAIVVGFAVSFSFGVLSSLILGLQRADLIARVRLGFNLVGAAGTVVVLSLGWGVNGLALNWLMSTAFYVTVSFVVAKRLFPALVLNPLRFRRSEFKAILRFSSKVQVTSLTLFLNDQVDRALIAYALGPAQLGYYQLAARATSVLAGVSFSFMSSVMPATSNLAAMVDTQRLRQLYLRATKYLAILDFGLCFGVGSLAWPITFAWLGPGYSRVALTMAIVLSGYVVWLPSQGTSDPLNGIGRPGIRMRADIAFLCIHIPLSVFLIWRFGYFGTVIGTGLALASTRLYIYRTGPPLLGIRAMDLVRHALIQPAVAGILASAAVVAMQVARVPLSLPMLLLELALFGSIYGGYVWFFALDKFDHTLVLERVDAGWRTLVERLA